MKDESNQINYQDDLTKAAIENQVTVSFLKKLISLNLRVKKLILVH